MITRADVRFSAVWVAIAVMSTAACDKDKTASSASNELQSVPPAKAGVPDDSVLTVAPTGTVIPNGGLRDPSVLPINPKGGLRDPSVLPINPKGGLRDPSVQPVNPKGGVPDDSIKPVAPTGPKPIP